MNTRDEICEFWIRAINRRVTAMTRNTERDCLSEGPGSAYWQLCEARGRFQDFVCRGRYDG